MPANVTPLTLRAIAADLESLEISVRSALLPATGQAVRNATLRQVADALGTHRGCMARLADRLDASTTLSPE